MAKQQPTETVSEIASKRSGYPTDPHSFPARRSSGPITVQLNDPYNNVATAASTQTVLLTTSSTAPFGVHFRDTGDTINIPSVTICVGASSASFKYNDTLAGSPMLAAADGALSSATHT